MTPGVFIGRFRHAGFGFGWKDPASSTLASMQQRGIEGVSLRLPTLSILALARGSSGFYRLCGEKGFRSVFFILSVSQCQGVSFDILAYTAFHLVYVFVTGCPDASTQNRGCRLPRAFVWRHMLRPSTELAVSSK